ncbi:hypothetical protein Tco_0823931 [Tanacetum coccineum]|uniref:Integrase, catalytic region, zinc finger, CCHC-type, peptidase aspartic, catalytic n=1 Tax=Tanacetum coccineum TaxID=301880 RepID=A0ABQ5AM09_9ASTR
MTTLAKFMIIAGADNRPPMLDKIMYDSWKNRMELYIENKKNGRMIFNSVENGPLIWHTVEENDKTRKKKYEELSASKKLQADCDLKATNIVLQGLPLDVYAIINHHKVAKEIWDRVKLLIQGTSLSLQKQECKLYDDFDKFTYVKVSKLEKQEGHVRVDINNPGDDPIAYLNKAMAFMSAVAASRFPLTNNQLRIFSKLRNATSKGHMTRQSTQPKRTRNAAWFKEKAMLVEAQESS